MFVGLLPNKIDAAGVVRVSVVTSASITDVSTVGVRCVHSIADVGH